MSDDDDLLLVDDDDEDYQADKYLLFKLGSEEYGINIANVQSIEEMQNIVHVPDMPVFIKGVINLRGKIIPAMDLRLRFHMETREYDDRSCIVIVDVNGFFVGLIVDTVSEVSNIPAKSVEPAIDLKNESGVDKYIRGFGKVGEKVKILLDISKILLKKDIEDISSSTVKMEA
ncbi:MAG: purine-binding chemotaxis protein CheW [Spirochaetales bacterium]|nr:purine-binding chemotaxis protein CheW [Spirochaetales bacterium]